MVNIVSDKVGLKTQNESMAQAETVSLRLTAWLHQAMTWSAFDLLSMCFFMMCLGTVSHDMLKISHLNDFKSFTSKISAKYFHKVNVNFM